MPVSTNWSARRLVPQHVEPRSRRPSPRGPDRGDRRRKDQLRAGRRPTPRRAERGAVGARPSGTATAGPPRGSSRSPGTPSRRYRSPSARPVALRTRSARAQVPRGEPPAQSEAGVGRGRRHQTRDVSPPARATARAAARTAAGPKAWTTAGFASPHQLAQSAHAAEVQGVPDRQRGHRRACAARSRDRPCTRTAVQAPRGARRRAANRSRGKRAGQAGRVAPASSADVEVGRQEEELQVCVFGFQVSHGAVMGAGRDAAHFNYETAPAKHYSPAGEHADERQVPVHYVVEVQCRSRRRTCPG